MSLRAALMRLDVERRRSGGATGVHADAVAREFECAYFDIVDIEAQIRSVIQRDFTVWKIQKLDSAVE